MPEAARIGDTITHTNKLGGFLAGALLGAAVGAFVVATGGAGALVIAGAVATGASLGSQIGKVFGGMKKVPKGQIMTGAATVFITGRAAARACIDTALCDDHTVKKIAMGSATVGIEGGAAARIGDQGECGFEVGEGAASVIIGGGQGMCPGLSVDSEVPAWMETASMILGLAGAGGLMRAAGWGALRIGAALVGGEVGSRVGGHYGQQWGGTWGGVFGSVAGGLLGGGAGSWAGRRATPLLNRLEVRTVGLGSNLGNVPVGLRPPARTGGIRPPDSPHYSVSYEAQLQRGQHYPGLSDKTHFAESNRQLHNAMQADPAFARSMEQLHPGITQGVAPGPRGAFPRDKPTPDVTWHHHPNREGVMQLIPTEQHRARGPIQASLHPDRKGGMQNWGGGRK